jgi:hypothetical protein
MCPCASRGWLSVSVDEGGRDGLEFLEVLGHALRVELRDGGAHLGIIDQHPSPGLPVRAVRGILAVARTDRPL